MLYPQNGDRSVTIDSVTSLQIVYSLRDLWFGVSPAKVKVA